MTVPPSNDLGWFLLDVFVYSPVAMYSFAYVWLKFYWNFLRKGGLFVILVEFEILHRQLFFKSDPSGLRVWGVCPSFLKL